MSSLRRISSIVVVVIGVALLGSCALQSVSSVAASLDEVLTGDHGLTAADGLLPSDATVFDTELAGIANLDPALVAALRAAALNAAGERIHIYITSGWRSPAYQDELLNEAINQYGSRAEAARWVATADTSPHVAGQAVDVGHADAQSWLADRGSQFGLCQIYRNEPWHYELRAEAIDGVCPRMYADPTRDPRMQE